MPITNSATIVLQYNLKATKIQQQHTDESFQMQDYNFGVAISFIKADFKDLFIDPSCHYNHLSALSCGFTAISPLHALRWRHNGCDGVSNH